ncbi:porin family protein [Winogradskyella schleiferi]|uniref:porin family protein n=1 Tax=Winogradskyella schleiferi TaxID=2686078 RepID=UPI0015BC2CA4|nr:porin family protein [Winogradskyella schleiferi]
MKNLFLVLAFITISSTVVSQVEIRPGVRGGVNFANLTNSNFDDKVDFYIGGFAAIKLANFYTLQPEINYSRQGGKAKFSGFENLEIQYVGMAITNKFAPFKDMGLNFIIGPAINIKVGDNLNSFNDDLEDFDFLFFGGLGYEFPFGLGVEARYNIGIVDVFGRNVNTDDYDDTNIDNLVLNKVFQIGATYKFDFK